jgi:hypothetical protein
MPRIFIAQTLVDAWLAAGQVGLDGDFLHFPLAGSPGSQPFPLYIQPAVYFDRVDGSDTDAYDVVGVVKTAGELAQLGAEHYDTSVVLGDYAYSVRPGFLAIPVGPDGGETVLDGPTWGRFLASFAAMAPGRV